MEVELRMGFMGVFMILADPDQVPGPWSAKEWPLAEKSTERENLESVLSVYLSAKRKLFDSESTVSGQ